MIGLSSFTYTCSSFIRKLSNAMPEDTSTFCSNLFQRDEKFNMMELFSYVCFSTVLRQP